MPQTELFSKKGVEIFSVGKWNDQNFTIDDLNEMVRAFDETKAGIEPSLKLGHNKEQNLLAKDGLPAAGWVDRMYVLNDKLMADFKEMPKKIYQLLENKAYKKVSVEMYEGLKIKDKAYKFLISAVSLLGADMPAVMNLSDILALYGVDQSQQKPKVYEQNLQTITRKDPPMPTKEEIRAEIEAEIKAEEAAKNAETLAAQVKEFAAKDAAKDAELKTLREAKANADAKALADAIALKESETKAFVTALKAEKLCTPAMEPLITELLGDEKKEYSVKIADKEEKLNKNELLKQALKLFSAAKEVNFAESSSKGKSDSNVDEADQEKQVQAYMAENKCSYGKAAKAILAQNKKK